MLKKLILKKRVLAIFGVAIFLIWLFNIQSNIHLVFENKGELFNTGFRHFEIVEEDEFYVVSQLNLWRRNCGLLQRCINKLSKPKLLLLKVKTKNGFQVALSSQGYTSYDLTQGSSTFAINSSFYERDFSIRGEVIVDGDKKGEASNSSGYFKVIDDTAIVGPKSLFKNRSGNINYSCQAHPSVMKNGVIWDYILKESKNQIFWKQKTYRSLVGVDDKNNICFLVSGNGGLVSIKETSLIAKKCGIKNATMLDAGAALQYSIKVGSNKTTFSSWNNLLNLGRTIDKIFRKIVGQRSYSSSPVFITHSH